MVSRRLGRAAAVVVLVVAWQASGAAFDTFWHSAATGAVAREFHFSADAGNILQFGNFAGPDFFGPLYDKVLGARLEQAEANSRAAQILKTFVDWRTGGRQLQVRKMAIFMHFDNLNGRLASNAQFDYLFLRLLKNTRDTLVAVSQRSDLNEGSKKIAILETLGASLHMVQDFYSHSDWTHVDFEKHGMPLVKTSWGKMRAPTWLEVRAKLGDPDGWPFKVQSGIYPPVPGAPNTHSHMNHDNSQLFYEEEENPGKPKRSQVPYHAVGPFPATEDNPREHQLFAVNTAAGASIEWVRVLEEDAAAKDAIDFAKDWDLKRFNVAMLHDLEGGLGSTLFLSCVLSKWDGFNPPEARQRQCHAMLGNAPTAMIVMPMLPGYSGIVPTPFNEFWAAEINQNIVEHLTKGFGGLDGNYMIDPTFVRATFPDGAKF